MKKLLFTLLAIGSLVACNKEISKPAIVLSEITSVSQTIYADEIQKLDFIKFYANEPWLATVKNATVKSSSDVEWLKLSAYQGGTGDFSISMTNTINTTGKDRKAEVIIASGETSITISVEQKSTKENGDAPTLPYITSDGNIKGGIILGNNPPKEIIAVVDLIVGKNSDHTVASTTYENNIFNIKLPVPDEQYQGEFTPGITVTPTNTKFSSGMLKYPTIQEGILQLTNISVENLNSKFYQIKKGDGYISFLYSSQDAVLDGTFIDSGITFILSNCKTRKGWNEIAIIAANDFTENGANAINMTINTATEGFHWIGVK